MTQLRSLPHSVGNVEIQKQRVLNRLREKATDLDRYEVSASAIERAERESARSYVRHASLRSDSVWAATTKDLSSL